MWTDVLLSVGSKTYRDSEKVNWCVKIILLNNVIGVQCLCIIHIYRSIHYMGLLAGIKYMHKLIITIRSWCWNMIHILDHQNNVSIAFSMSGNLGLDTLILIIPAILAKIQGYWFFTFRWKRASDYHINHQFLKNAQGLQLGTLQILILHGLMISNQSKPIVGPLLQG